MKPRSPIPSFPPVRIHLNPRARPARTYPETLTAILSLAAHEVAFRRIRTWPGYAPTPLHALTGLGRRLGLSRLWYKDEGARMGLGSFKALGGIYGVYRVLAEAREPPGPTQARELAARKGKDGVGTQEGAESLPTTDERLPDLTVTCASVGNHGRSVARGAQMFGCRAVIFVPAHTSAERVRAIQALGAEVVSVQGSYDDAVLEAAQRADTEGWWVVSDTAYPGYEEVPRHIMQGYTVLAEEVLRQLPPNELPTHVFLQAGVGGLAGAVTAHFWERLGTRRPRVVVVEPAEADGLLESALADGPTPASGTLRTAMECLACRAPSTLSWEILREGADAFLSLDDEGVRATVELLARGVGGDPPIATQPSGAAGLAGLIVALSEPGLSRALSLGPEARVLVIGSEGAPPF